MTSEILAGLNCSSRQHLSTAPIPLRRCLGGYRPSKKAPPCDGASFRQSRENELLTRYGAGATIRATTMQPLLIALSTTAATYWTKNATGLNGCCRLSAQRWNSGIASAPLPILPIGHVFRERMHLPGAVS